MQLKRVTSSVENVKEADVATKKSSAALKKSREGGQGRDTTNKSIRGGGGGNYRAIRLASIKMDFSRKSNLTV